MAGKYTPFEHYLRRLPATTRDVTLTFDQVERIINDKLPPSAFTRSVWWANEKNSSKVECHSWMGAGWKVEHVDLHRKVVRFVRGKV